VTHSHIQAILDAEERAREAIARAGVEAERIVGEAKRESITSLAENEAGLRSGREQRIASLKAQLDKERKELLAKKRAEADGLVHRSRKRYDQAVDVLIGRITA
jgi:vacuolar-type H+-ATPase subunit H